MTRSCQRPAINARRSTLDARRSTLTSKRETVRGGFTLIETALALLAIGLGLMAIFGLGRIGLQTSKEAENDSRCVQLADAVFETLRETNTRYISYAQSNQTADAWNTLWQNVYNSRTEKLPFPPVANMSASSNLWLQVNTEFVPAFDKDALSLSDWNPRYELAVSPGGVSSVAGRINLLRVTLAIYPDGDTYSSERRIFHTTLTNPGGLP